MTRSRNRRYLPGIALALLGAVILMTRVLARQKTVWEWDDVIFQIALHNFSPQNYIPQAPFYPGFVYIARLFRLVLPDDHLALTWVSVVASGAAPFFLASIGRRIFGEWRIGISAALLFSFFPQVWLHAGIPLSDPAGLSLTLLALGLTLEARRRPGIAWIAALSLAVAFSVRPQTALIAAFPFAELLYSLRGRMRWRIAGAFTLGILLFYILPIFASGSLSGAIRTFQWQGRYVVSTDSVIAPRRGLLRSLWRYGMGCWGWRKLGSAVLSAALLGAFVLWRKNRRAFLWIAATFLPYAAMCVFLLDPHIAGRYSLPFLPGIALLAAAGFSALETRFLPGGFPLLAATATVWSAVVVWPSIRILHTQPSPPAAAAQAIRTLAGSSGADVLFDPGLFLQAQLLLRGERLFPNDEAQKEGGAISYSTPRWRYGALPALGSSSVASWPQTAGFLQVCRGRYLQVPYGPLMASPIAFGDGWFPPEILRESEGRVETFRWMGRHAFLRFSFPGSNGKLHLLFVVPPELKQRMPQITIRLNGHVLERISANSSLSSLVVALPDSLRRSGQDDVIEIETSEAFTPSAFGHGEDPRVLGLRFLDIRLEP